MLIKACLNGSRARREHAAIPLTAGELARDAREAVEAGVAALHIHPRREDGSETLEPAACAAAIRAVRAACPGIPLGLSTGIWIENAPAARLSRIAAWTLLPDFISVNFSEPGTLELCETLISRRIGIEAGLWTLLDARAFVESGLSDRCLRILIEPREQDSTEALSTAAAIDAVLDEFGVRLPRLLHGEGRPAWEVLVGALRRGHDIRIGFEDTLVLPDGRLAHSNADLVAAAVRLAHQHRNPPR